MNPTVEVFLMWTSDEGEQELTLKALTCAESKAFILQKIQVKRDSKIFVHILGAYCNIQLNIRVPGANPLNNKGLPKNTFLENLDFEEAKVSLTYHTLKRKNGFSITNGIVLNFKNSEWWKQVETKKRKASALFNIVNEARRKEESLLRYHSHIQGIKTSILDLQAELNQLETEYCGMEREVNEINCKRLRLQEEWDASCKEQVKVK